MDKLRTIRQLLKNFREWPHSYEGSSFNIVIDEQPIGPTIKGKDIFIWAALLGAHFDNVSIKRS